MTGGPGGGRIGAAFRTLEEEGRAGFIPFLTSGFPTPADTPRLLRRLADAGADVIELGVPFSDPLADGPTIQRASGRALEQGVTLESSLRTLGELAADLPPVVVFSYLNPILRMGIDRFLARAEAAGASGLLLTDLPVGMHPALEEKLAGGALDLVPLVAPTTTRERIERIAGSASGFLYYISRLGVTGARERLDRRLGPKLEALRAAVRLPVAVGFGISTPGQAREVARIADGVVVGSALIAALERSEEAFVGLAADLAAAVRTGRSEAPD